MISDGGDLDAALRERDETLLAIVDCFRHARGAYARAAEILQRHNLLVASLTGRHAGEAVWNEPAIAALRAKLS